MLIKDLLIEIRLRRSPMTIKGSGGTGAGTRPRGAGAARRAIRRLLTR